MKKIFILICMLAFFTLLINCSDNRCNESKDVELKAEIIVNDASLTNSQFIENLSIYSPIWVDSVHYNNSNNFILELTPFSDTTIFVCASQSRKDTVWVFYKRQLVYLSQECGFVNYYSIDSSKYTTHNIDSLIWVNKKLTTSADGHVKIYY